MKSDKQLRSYVMRRVYFMYCTRLVCKPIPRVAVLTVLVLALVGSVSTVNILMNVLSVNSLQGLAAFVLSAFVNTTLTVQVVTAGIVGMVLWFLVDTAKHVQISTLDGADVAPQMSH